MRAKSIPAVAAIVLVLGASACAAESTGGSSSGDGRGSSAEKVPGRYQNPKDIKVGKAFEVDGFNYAAGWRIKNSFGVSDVKALKVTNNRDKSDSALVTMKAWKDKEVVASIDCTSDPIAPGTTVTLSCFGDALPKQYKRLTIEDSF
ncbi:hypothetical protein [Nocardioides marmoraquaticus]